MQTVDDYAVAVARLERGEVPAYFDTAGEAAAFLRRELAGIPWQPWARAEVRALAARLAAVHSLAK